MPYAVLYSVCMGIYIVVSGCASFTTGEHAVTQTVICVIMCMFELAVCLQTKPRGVVV